MSLYDWLLFLHVLSAFSLVAGVILNTCVIVVSRNAFRPSDAGRSLRLMRAGDVLSGIGAVGTLVFGVWLAIEVDGYELWDGWIIAALVLWAVSGGFGDRAAKHYARARKRAAELVSQGRNEPNAELANLLRAPRPFAFYAVAVALVLLLLADMIWKPGA